MPSVERTAEEIITALQRWVLRHPQPDVPSVGWGGGTQYSPRQFALGTDSALDLRSEYIMQILANARLQSFDPVEMIDSHMPGEEKE